MSAKRRMPLEKEWFDKKTNDILYGFMQAAATYKPEEVERNKQLYYSKADFNTDMKVIKTILRVKDKKNVMTKVKGLIEKGYIAEDAMNYYFPYNPENPYILVDKELLFYICTALSEFSLKVYVYLLNKQGFKNNYQFTVRELKEAFGYSSTTKTIDATLNACLHALQEIGIIKYHAEYVDLTTAKGEYKVPNYILDNVAYHLPETIKKSLQEMEQMNKEVDKIAAVTTEEERREAGFHF